MDYYTTIINSPFAEVNRFLNASDIALLLREDIPMNNVASPTKFAEYLMSGLPTIISKGVYDFAETIYTTNFGIVIEDYQHIEDQEFNMIYNLKDLNRENIALWAKMNLSKEKFISQYVKFFYEI
jgi:glycosyltransferase involved in cell wall biosynthesis